jgi:hypothetical protein
MVIRTVLPYPKGDGAVAAFADKLIERHDQDLKELIPMVGPIMGVPALLFSG